MPMADSCVGGGSGGGQGAGGQRQQRHGNQRPHVRRAGDARPSQTRHPRGWAPRGCFWRARPGSVAGAVNDVEEAKAGEHEGCMACRRPLPVATAQRAALPCSAFYRRCATLLVHNKASKHSLQMLAVSRARYVATGRIM